MPDDTNQEPSWDAIARALFEATAPDGEAPEELLNACRALPELRAALVELQHEDGIDAFKQRARLVLSTAQAQSPADFAQRFERVSRPVGTPTPPPAIVGAAAIASPAKPTGPTEASLYDLVAAHVMSYALAGIADVLQEQFTRLRRQHAHLIDANPVLREWEDAVRRLLTFVKAGEMRAPQVLAKQFQSFEPQDQDCVKPPEEPLASTPRRLPSLAVVSVGVAVLIAVMLAMWSWTVLLGGGAR